MIMLLTLLLLLAQESTKDSLDTVKERLAKKEAVLVDVREEKEWKEGHVDGAIFVPLSWLRDAKPEEVEARLPKKPIVYLYCRSGNRSLVAAGILGKQGYDARSLRPGFAALVEAGFPAER